MAIESCVKRNHRRAKNHRRLAFEGLGGNVRPKTLRIEPLESRMLLSVVAWTGGPLGTGTNWDQASNWSTGAVPTADDDVSISTAAAATITIQSGDLAVAHSLTTAAGDTLAITGGSLALGADSILAGDMNFSGGTLGGAGNVAFTGTANWTGGTMAAGGTTVIAAGGTLNISGSNGVLLDRVLENDGVANWTSGPILMANATLNNNGTWTANSNLILQAFDDVSGTVNAFNNNAGGTFTQEGTGTTQFLTYYSYPITYPGVSFNNAGTVNVNQGELDLSGGGTNSAAINVSPGAAASFSNDYTHAAGSSLSNLGTINFSATQTVLGPLTIGGTLNITSGTITGAGNVTFAGTANWTGGTMDGTGTTVIASGGTLNITNTVTLGGVLENDGTASWTAGTIYMVNGTINNYGTWTANSNSTLTALSDVTGTVNAFNSNAGGTFTQAGTGATQFISFYSYPITYPGVSFNNAGAVNVSQGELDLSAGGTQTGVFTIATGATLGLSGVQTFSAVSTVNCAGTLSIPGGTADFSNSPTIVTLSVSGGTADFDAVSTLGNLNFSAGTLGGAGNATFTGTVNWTGGTMAAGGTTLIASGGTLNLSGNGNGLYLQRVLENDGTANWMSGSMQMSNGTINNNGTWTANSSSALQAFGIANGTVNAFNNNAGATFTQEGTGTTQFMTYYSYPFTYPGVAFNNAGAVNVSQGELDLSAGGTQTGGFTVPEGSTLLLNGAHSFSAASTLNCSGTLSVPGGTANFNNSPTIGNLNLNGTLGGAGSVTVAGTANWTGGAMGGTGTTVIAAGGTLNIPPSNGVAVDRVLENDGTVNWTGSLLYISDGTVNNNGTWTASGSSVLGLPGSTANAFNNNAGATFTKLGTGPTQFINPGQGYKDVSFNNAGTVNVSQGELDLSTGGSNSAAINVSPGAVANFSSNYTHAAGSSLNNLGTINFSATQTVLGPLTIAGTLNLNGTLGGAGNETLTGTANWTGGTMAAGATTVIAAGGTLNIPPSNGVAVDRVLENDGTVNWTGSLLYISDGTVNNNGTWTASGSSVLGLPGSTANAFNNNAGATFTKLGTGTTQFTNPGQGYEDVSFNNAGSVSVSQGELDLDTGGTNSAAINVSPGAVASFSNDYTHAAGSSLNNLGTINFASTQTLAGPLTIGGTLNFTSGTITGAGNLTFTGSLNWAGGTMSGTGSTAIASRGTLNVSGGVNLQRVLENDGTANWSGGSSITMSNASIDNNGTWAANSNSSLQVSGSGAAFNNAGALLVSGGAATANFFVPFNNTGRIAISSGALDLHGGSLALGASSQFLSAPETTLSLGGSLGGQIQSANHFAPQGNLVFAPGGSAANPQTLEVMSQDLGDTAAGFQQNATYGAIQLSNATFLQLVDQAQNSAGTGPEALYVESLLVPVGSTLDLHGLHVYARAMQIGGTVLNGQAAQFPPGGPIALGVPLPGLINAANPDNAWTFFGRAGQSVSIVVNPGSPTSPLPPLSPGLGYAQVQLLDDQGNVLASAGNAQGNTSVVLAVPLTADGVYTIQVAPPASQPLATGNYEIGVYDASLRVRPLPLNQAVYGQLYTGYEQDQWTFSAQAGDQVQFSQLAAAIPGLLFDLKGPDGADIALTSSVMTLPQTGTYGSFQKFYISALEESR